MSAEAATWHAEWLRERPADYGADVLLRIRGGLLVRATEYLLAQQMRTLIQADFAAAFQQVLGRLPTAEERAECQDFLVRQAALLADPARLTPFETGAANPVPPSADPKQRARESLVHVLLNHNDFVTIR